MGQENPYTEKQLELAKRILIKLKEEKDILLRRQKIILDTELEDLIVDGMSVMEQTPEYLGTIQSLKLNSIENRLIQLEGEIEGTKLYIEEIKAGIANKSKKQQQKKNG